MTNKKAAPVEQPKVEVPAEPKTFVFKSKFGEDKLTLKKQIIEALPDGSKRVTGTEFAEFSQNTFSTQDPEVARLLRERIKAREKAGIPLGVIETTEGVDHGVHTQSSP